MQTADTCVAGFPELARLPDRYLHAPWLAPDEVLRKLESAWAKRTDAARRTGCGPQRALAALETLKSSTA